MPWVHRVRGGNCRSGVCLMEAVKGKLGFQAERADSVKERRTPCRIVEENAMPEWRQVDKLPPSPCPELPSIWSIT